MRRSRRVTRTSRRRGARVAGARAARGPAHLGIARGVCCRPRFVYARSGVRRGRSRRHGRGRRVLWRSGRVPGRTPEPTAVGIRPVCQCRSRDFRHAAGRSAVDTCTARDRTIPASTLLLEMISMKRRQRWSLVTAAALLVALPAKSSLVADEPAAAPPASITFESFTWPSQPPQDIPFTQSRELAGIRFLGRCSDYRVADTWCQVTPPAIGHPVMHTETWRLCATGYASGVV